MQSVPADSLATFAASLSRLLNRELVRDAPGLGSFPALLGNFSPLLCGKGSKSAFTRCHARQL